MTVVKHRGPSDDRSSAEWVDSGALPVRFGALAFLVCLLAYVALAWRVSQPQVPRIDVATTAFLHGLANPTLDAIMEAATWLGSTEVLLTVVALAAVGLAASGRRAEAVFVVVALAGALVVNDVLKTAVQRPRPGFDWAGGVPEYSFPSGHSMKSFVTYVALALVVWRLNGRRSGVVALVLALTLVVGIGTSRIYLGAHWLTDVIGAYLAGALWLMCLIAAYAALARLPTRDRPTAPA